MTVMLSHGILHRNVQGQYPFDMHEAADCLMDLATGVYDMNPLLDCQWFGGLGFDCLV